MPGPHAERKPLWGQQGHPGLDGALDRAGSVADWKRNTQGALKHDVEGTQELSVAVQGLRVGALALPLGGPCPRVSCMQRCSGQRGPAPFGLRFLKRFLCSAAQERQKRQSPGTHDDRRAIGCRGLLFTSTSHKSAILLFRCCQCSWGEALMETKCVRCDILLDVPCAHPGCAGHHNERQGDVCLLCHQRAGKYGLSAPCVELL